MGKQGKGEKGLRIGLDGEIHLWFAFIGEGDASQETLQVLDHEERTRMERLHLPAGRRLFGASHALVRKALSHYGKIPPEKWRFVKGAHGKPSIDPDLAAPPLRFSLAHTRGAALVAVTEGADVGADLERGDRRVDAARLSRRFFSPAEDAELKRTAPGLLRTRFFHLWTLKESYIKARGLGLSLPLDSFSFHLAGDPPGRIAFSSDDAEQDAAGQWRFALLTPLAPYVAAVGFSSAGPGSLRLRCFGALPSGEVSPLAVEPLGLSPGVEIEGEPFS
jgi:4'-phosphopantetheinyl transferase